MRTTFDFARLWRSTIGFDHLAELVDSALRQATEDNYPPYNIERSGEDHYRIGLAVAGFKVNDIALTFTAKTYGLRNPRNQMRTQ